MTPRGCSVLAALIVCFAALPAAAGQVGLRAPGPELRRIYVGDFGGKPEAAALRNAVIEQIRKSKDFMVAESPAESDAELAGDAEIYIRGYYSLYARAGTSPANGKPVYGGYVSVE